MKDFKLANTTTFEDSRSIAKEIFSGSAFPDFRLKKRAISIFSTLLRYVGKPFGQAFGEWGSTKAFYRFIENERVESEMLGETICKQGAINCRSHDKVYAVNDTTVVEIKHSLMNEELGSIDQFADHLGMLLHSTMGVSAKGLPLGLLNQQFWTREKKVKKKLSKKEREREKSEAKKRPIEEKESYKWLRAVESTKQVLSEQLGDSMPQIVFVGDRESDIYEYFEKIKQEEVGTITRVTHNRQVEGSEEKLRAHVLSQEVKKTLTLKVPRNRTRKKRKARVSIRYVSEVTLLAPKNRGVLLPKIQLGAVYVKEIDPPATLKPREVIDWFLLTTEPVENVDDALDIIEKYKYRWLIEVFHYVLKSGCRIEKYQFEKFERYHKIIILQSEVAFELLRMTHISRIHPDFPATEILSQLHIDVLKIQTRIRAGPPLTVKVAVALIGRMGGHLGRKSDGFPGVKTLWQGWRDLNLLVDFVKTGRNLDE